MSTVSKPYDAALLREAVAAGLAATPTVGDLGAAESARREFRAALALSRLKRR